MDSLLNLKPLEEAIETKLWQFEVYASVFCVVIAIIAFLESESFEDAIPRMRLAWEGTSF